MDPDLSALDAGPGVPAFFVVLFVLIALIGVAVVAGGLRSALRARARSADAARLRTEGVTTTGLVVDNRMTSRRERGTSFSPIVAFDAGGRQVVVVGEQVWNRSFVTGRPARVVYDPAAPDRAHVRAEGGSVVGHGVTGVVVAVFGVAFLVVVAVMARFALSVF